MSTFCFGVSGKNSHKKQLKKYFCYCYIIELNMQFDSVSKMDLLTKYLYSTYLSDEFLTIYVRVCSYVNAPKDRLHL